MSTMVVKDHIPLHPLKLYNGRIAHEFFKT